MRKPLLGNDGWTIPKGCAFARHIPFLTNSCRSKSAGERATRGDALMVDFPHCNKTAVNVEIYV